MKLYRELVGLDPDASTVDRLAATFRRDYAILPLVEAIVSDRMFTSDQAVRAKVRTPVEKLVGILQALPSAKLQIGQVRPNARNRGANGSTGQALRTLGFIPFVPPNVGGFPKGNSLLGPHQLVHTFDLLSAVDAPPPNADVETLFTRLGLHDVSETSRRVVGKERDSGRRFALAVSSPEYALV
jgi:uncharacterized protein (DUF1800 family)